MKSFNLKNAILFVGLFLSILVSYFYVVDGDFIGDDVDRINFNAELNEYGTALTGGLADRPLLMFYVTTIFKLFGRSSTAFHLFSYLLHAFVAFQLFQLLSELLKARFNIENKTVPVFMAFLFALHPLNSQAVTTAIQAGVLISALFGVLSLRHFFKYIEDRSNKNLGFVLLYFFIACLAKQNLVFLPVFFFFGFKILDKIEKREWNLIGLCVGVLLIPIFYYTIYGKNLQTFAMSPIRYFLVQTEVVFTYFKLMVVPFGMKFLYDFETPENIFWNANLLFLAAHIILFTGVYRFLPSKVTKLIWIGFYLTFLPESSFFPIDHTAFEHRTYVPMIFLFTLLGILVAQKLNEVRRPVFQLAGTVILIVFVLLNQFRNLEIKRWGDWALHTLQHSSSYPFTNFALSYYLLRAGYHDQVMPIIETYRKYPAIHEFDLLFDIADYYKYPEKKMESFKKFNDFLLLRNLTAYSRFVLSKILLTDFADPEVDFQLSAQSGYTLAKQLRYYVLKRDQYFTSLFGFFSLSQKLLNSTHAQNFKDFDIYKYVTVKVGSCLYFGKMCSDLGEDFKLALSKTDDPNEKEDLTFMFKQFEKKQSEKSL